MINLVNRAVISANVTLTGTFAPLRCAATNFSSRTFVELHLPRDAVSPLEWSYSSDVDFGERIRPGETHTWRVGPNVDVLIRSVGADVEVLIHEGS